MRQLPKNIFDTPTIEIVKKDLLIERINVEIAAEEEHKQNTIVDSVIIEITGRLRALRQVLKIVNELSEKIAK